MNKEERIMRAFLTLIVLLSVSIVFFESPLKADQSKENEAVQYAQNWLEIVDSGEYDESWMQAASIFRNAVQKEQWAASMNAFRKPLGKLVKRTIKNKQYRKSLPSVPDGEYVVIQFDTTFENKIKSIETITPMLDIDGKWRVSGYYIN